MTVLTFCLSSTFNNFFPKWFHTREVLALALIVVLVGFCVSETIISCSAGCVSCCSCVSVKREPEIVRALVMLTLKVENMRNLEEGRK